jgi:hypothetical protein
MTRRVPHSTEFLVMRKHLQYAERKLRHGVDLIDRQVSYQIRTRGRVDWGEWREKLAPELTELHASVETLERILAVPDGAP